MSVSGKNLSLRGDSLRNPKEGFPQKEYVGLVTLVEQVEAHSSFVICGHVNPDGDCIGSQLALMHGLRALGKVATALLAVENSVGHDLLFLPGIEELLLAEDYDAANASEDSAVANASEDSAAANPPKTSPVYIAVDVSTPGRLGKRIEELFSRAELTLAMDHHESVEPIAQFTYADPQAASTTMLVWEILELLESRAMESALTESGMSAKSVPLKSVFLDGRVATCAYTGLVTDTGRFEFQNTDAAAFRAALKMVERGAAPGQIARELYQNVRPATLKLQQVLLSRMRIGAAGRYAFSTLLLRDFEEFGATKADADQLINILRNIEGVEIACILREASDGEVRGSLRSKGDIDVTRLAGVFGGGGHKAAAGFSFVGGIDEAVEKLSSLLARTFESDLSEESGFDQAIEPETVSG